MINAINEFEPVTVGVVKEFYNRCKELVDDSVNVVELSSNDSWVRDTGPTFVVRDEVCEEGCSAVKKRFVRGIQWQFNAYGGPELGCYYPYDLDQQLATKILQITQAAR